MKKIFALLCLLILTVPAAGLVISRPDLTKENRDQAVTESVWLRPGMVAAHARFSALLGVSGSDQVTLGKNGYLYLTETLPAAVGISRLTDGEVEQIAAYLKSLADTLAARGCRLIFLCAPNKATAVPENLPAYARPAAGPSALDALQSRLRALHVDLIDAKALLTPDMYYRTDTHWNDRGALKVYLALRDMLGAEEWSDYGDLAFETENRRGDLTELIYPEDGPEEAVEAARLSRRFITRGVLRSPMDLKILASCKEGTGHIVLIRDSFANNLFPYIANNAATTRIFRASRWEEGMGGEETNAVILEIAERNLRRIIEAEAPGD